jgi:hypothetical protein
MYNLRQAFLHVVIFSLTGFRVGVSAQETWWVSKHIKIRYSNLIPVRCGKNYKPTQPIVPPGKALKPTNLSVLETY